MRALVHPSVPASDRSSTLRRRGCGGKEALNLQEPSGRSSKVGPELNAHRPLILLCSSYLYSQMHQFALAYTFLHTRCSVSTKGEPLVLNKVLVLVIVLLIAVVVNVPAFAQTPDLGLEWGSQEWLIGQYGDEFGDVTTFCETAGQTADTIAGWGAAHPGLYELCGWSVE